MKWIRTSLLLFVLLLLDLLSGDVFEWEVVGLLSTGEVLTLLLTDPSESELLDDDELESLLKIKLNQQKKLIWILQARLWKSEK